MASILTNFSNKVSQWVLTIDSKQINYNIFKQYLKCTPGSIGAMASGKDRQKILIQIMNSNLSKNDAEQILKFINLKNSEDNNLAGTPAINDQKLSDIAKVLLRLKNDHRSLTFFHTGPTKAYKTALEYLNSLVDTVSLQNNENICFKGAGAFGLFGACEYRLPRHQDLTDCDLRGKNLEKVNLQLVKLTNTKLDKAGLEIAIRTNANLSGVDLSNQDLRNMNLEGINLRDVNLKGANLRGAYLQRANLQGAILKETKLDKAGLRIAIKTNANLSGVDLSGQDLSNMDLTYIDLRDVDLSRVNLLGVSLKGTKLNKAGLEIAIKTNANLSGVDLSDQDLNNINLKGINLWDVNLSGTNLRGANLQRANLQGAILKETKLDKAGLKIAIETKVNLSGVDLSDQDLSNMNLTGIDLREVNLSRANLLGVSLKGTKLNKAGLEIAIKANANLSGVDLSDQDLRDMDLTYIDLREVNLKGTNLLGVSLKGTKLNKAGLEIAIKTNANLSGVDLSNQDLSNMNLKGINLRKANLSGANLSGAILKDTKLDKAGLEVAIKTTTNLSYVDLSDQDLSNMNLTGIDLREANLSRANLLGVILKGTTLNKAGLEIAIKANANLSGVYLSNQDLRDMDLTGINLQKANLIGANLRGANLQRANLQGAILKNTKLDKDGLKIAIETTVNLSGVDLSNQDLSNMNLTGIDLREVNLRQANLQNANLQNANLEGAKLLWANLQNANLDMANLQNTNFREAADLRGASLDGTILNNNTLIQIINMRNYPHLITQKFSLSFSDNLDTDFNHINNLTTGSFLTTINSIPDQYIEQKIYLMHQVINHLSNKDITTIIPALTDILFNHPIYYNDDKIKSFIADKILLCVIKKANQQQWINPSNQEINILLDYAINKGAEYYIKNNNNFFIQLIWHGFNSGNKKTQQNTTKLYNQYLEDSKIKNVQTQLDELYSWEENPYKSNSKLNAQYKLIFYSDQQKQFLVVNFKYMKKFYNNCLANWGLCYVYEHDNQTGTIKLITLGTNDHSLENIFNVFTVFQNKFLHLQKNAMLAKLLSILNLGTYKTYFEQALTHKYYNNNLTSDTHKNAFADIFAKFVKNGLEIISQTVEYALNIELTFEHFYQILTVYNITNSSNKEKAQLFACLSAVFVKYSSSHFFGCENDSIVPLRNYALALLNKAIELDKTVIDSKYLQDNIDNWKYKFTGTMNAFSCTAALSEVMITEIKTKFHSVLNSILPPAWA